MEPNSSKCSNIQTVHLIELKFGTYIIGHRPTHCVDFCKFRINGFSYRSTKTILLQYSLWSQIIKNKLALNGVLDEAQV